VSANANVLRVTSHVARDLLQSAELFQHPPNVIWEYVSNGLQYVDPGTVPTVSVIVEQKPKKIVVEDNGRGMLLDDLRRFFTMHGENADRVQGRPGRGYFGTGKSAAFAVGDVLRITTVRNGKESVVELHRSDLLAASSGAPVPVRELEIEAPTTRPNGTKVEIERLKNVRLDRDEIIKTLERHVRHWRGGRVEVNGVEVEYTIPPIAMTREYIATDEDHTALSGVRLFLNAAKVPLPEADRGVAILSGGVLHDTTLAGAERRDFSNYIFGEIDVPTLAEPFEGIPAFDMSRSGRLNQQNPIVFATYAFVGRHIEALRRELVEQDKARRAEVESVKLQEQANEIARFLNADFTEFKSRLQGKSQRAGGAYEIPSLAPGDSGAHAFVEGGVQPAVQVADEGAPGEVEPNPEPSPPPEEPTPNVGPVVEVASPEVATTTASEVLVAEGLKRRAGGFDVKYRNNGSETTRAFYQRDAKTIFINLDHPQISAARGEGDVTDPMFRRLSFEVAFNEYAYALSFELVDKGEFMDLLEPIQAVRETVDRLARRAAEVFRA